MDNQFYSVGFGVLTLVGVVWSFFIIYLLKIEKSYSKNQAFLETSFIVITVFTPTTVLWIYFSDLFTDNKILSFKALIISYSILLTYKKLNTKSKLVWVYKLLLCCYSIFISICVVVDEWFKYVEYIDDIYTAALTILAGFYFLNNKNETCKECGNAVKPPA